jgi:nicotinamide N-methyltransferase
VGIKERGLREVYKPGSGLAGIVSALAGADEMVISDYPSPGVIANINVNVEKNVPEYIRNKNINQHHTLRLGAVLETTKDPLKVDAESPEIVSHCGHKWGDLTDRLAQSHAQHFTRIIAADCLWMVGEHESLVESMLHFLSRDEDAQVWVMAGFHTGRAKVAAFFDTAVDMGLKISKIYERDVEGHERAWARERDRGREDVTERMRWLVVAILKRKPSTTSEWRDSTATLALPDESRYSTSTLVA